MAEKEGLRNASTQRQGCCVSVTEEGVANPFSRCYSKHSCKINCCLVLVYMVASYLLILYRSLLFEHSVTIKTQIQVESSILYDESVEYGDSHGYKDHFSDDDDDSATGDDGQSSRNTDCSVERDNVEDAIQNRNDDDLDSVDSADDLTARAVALVSCYYGISNTSDLLQNLCPADTIRRYALKQTTDDRYCGVNSLNFQGCLPGFYQPVNQSLTAPTDDAADDVDDTGDDYLGLLVDDDYPDDYDRFGPARPCPDGFFCPADLVCLILCPFGGNCQQSNFTNSNESNCDFPAGSSLSGGKPKRIYDSSYFASERSELDKNESRKLCRGAEALGPCAPGYYCPTPMESHKCPKYHFCPAGSWKPRDCFWSVLCPQEGLDRPSGVTISIGIITAFLVTFFAFLDIYGFAMKKFKDRRKAVKKKQRECGKTVSVVRSDHPPSVHNKLHSDDFPHDEKECKSVHLELGSMGEGLPALNRESSSEGPPALNRESSWFGMGLVAGNGSGRERTNTILRQSLITDAAHAAEGLRATTTNMLANMQLITVRDPGGGKSLVTNMPATTKAVDWDDWDEDNETNNPDQDDDDADALKFYCCGCNRSFHLGSVLISVLALVLTVSLFDDIPLAFLILCCVFVFPLGLLGACALCMLPSQRHMSKILAANRLQQDLVKLRVDESGSLATDITNIDDLQAQAELGGGSEVTLIADILNDDADIQLFGGCGSIPHQIFVLIGVLSIILFVTVSNQFTDYIEFCFIVTLPLMLYGLVGSVVLRWRQNESNRNDTEMDKQRTYLITIPQHCNAGDKFTCRVPVQINDDDEPRFSVFAKSVGSLRSHFSTKRIRASRSREELKSVQITVPSDAGPGQVIEFQVTNKRPQQRGSLLNTLSSARNMAMKRPSLLGRGTLDSLRDGSMSSKSMRSQDGAPSFDLREHSFASSTTSGAFSDHTPTTVLEGDEDDDDDQEQQRRTSTGSQPSISSVYPDQKQQQPAGGVRFDMPSSSVDDQRNPMSSKPRPSDASLWATNIHRVQTTITANGIMRTFETQTKTTKLDITFKELSLELNTTGHKVLAGVTGACLSGNVTAVMGPSGAGKTTFLNALSGKATYARMSGEILFNGVKDSIRKFGYVIGFVPQDDIMFTELTVEEILTTYAWLRQPRGTQASQIRSVVDDVVEKLGLAHIRGSVVGDAAKRGISGGQRKRVNVGMEMVSSPAVLFLDEPTSGLDSTTSFELVAALRQLADEGTNVITVLHQPSYPLYQMFHCVLLLGKGGRTVFLGRSEDALPYFTTTLGFVMPDFANPADFFMDSIAGKYERVKANQYEELNLFELWDIYQSSFEGKIMEAHSPAQPISPAALGQKRPRGFIRSMLIFMWRACLQIAHNPRALLTDCVLELVAGLALGYMYADVTLSSIAGSNLMFCLGLGLTVSLASLKTFGAERLVFWREAAPGAGMNLDPLAYFIAKNIVDLPRIILLTAMITFAFYPQANPLTSLGEFYIKALAGAFSATGWAYILSILFEPKSAQLYCVVVLLVLTMVSGINPPLKTIYETSPPQYAFTWLSYARWLGEDLFVSHTYQLSAAFRMPPYLYAQPASYSLLAYLLKLDYSEALQANYYSPSLPMNSMMNVWLGFTLRILAFLSLVMANREKRGIPSYQSAFSVRFIDPVVDLLYLRGKKHKD